MSTQILFNYVPACPECNSTSVSRTIRYEENEAIVSCDKNGGILDTKSLDIIDEEQLGPYECDNGHTFRRFVVWVASGQKP